VVSELKNFSDLSKPSSLRGSSVFVWPWNSFSGLRARLYFNSAENEFREKSGHGGVRAVSLAWHFAYRKVCNRVLQQAAGIKRQTIDQPDIEYQEFYGTRLAQCSTLAKEAKNSWYGT
jgi:hypothetical protein